MLLIYLDAVLESDIRRVIGQVQEKGDTFHAAILFEVARKESTRLHVDTHGSEHNGEILLMSIMDIFRRLVNQTRLTTNLGSNFVVRQTSSRKDRDFLATGNGIHCVNRGYSSSNHFLRIHLRLFSEKLPTGGLELIYPRVRIDRTSIDVQVILC